MRNGKLITIVNASDMSERQLLGLFVGVEGTEQLAG